MQWNYPDPPSQRNMAIFYAVEVEGVSYEHVARVMQVKPATVRSIVSQVRGYFRIRQAQEFFEQLYDQTPRG